MRKSFIIIAVAVLSCLFVHSFAADGVGWIDNFDELSPIRWKQIPKIASVGIKDTLSAANRVMILSPHRGQQYLLSAEKFTHGDMEVIFSSTRPKSGDNFYYIGFHANQPWLKSVCWVLIHNEVVNFSVKTVDGVRLHKKIGEVRKGAYNHLKISQSTGKILVEFNGKKFNFDDPKLISGEPMYAFIGANTGNNKIPAELRVDYMKVSGGAVAPRLAARKLSGGELSAVEKNGKIIELKAKESSFALKLDGGLHWGEIRQNGKLVNDPAVFVPVFAVAIDGQLFYSNELAFDRAEKSSSAFKAFFKEKASGTELCLTGEVIRKDGVKLNLSAVNKSAKSRKIQLIFPITASLIAPGEAENTKYFFPWRSGLFGKVTADFSTEYGGLGWMQLQFAVNEKQKTGLMFYPLDTNGSFKGLRMLRQHNGEVKVHHMESVNRADYPAVDMLEKQSGMVLMQYYRSRQLAPGKKTASCDILMAVFDGNWKTPLREYSAFMRKAMKPVNVPRWFRDTFTWLNAHPPFYYDKNAARYTMADKLAGGEHSAQLAFWDDYVELPKSAQVSQLERYQPGDFLVNKSRGGDEAFKAEIARVQKRNTRMTVYIDHRFCWKNTDTAKRFGKAWGTMNQLGNYNGYISSNDLYLMCFYDADKWVKYMSDTCFRLMSTLGLDGIYLDELGIAFPCYNPSHDHVKKGEFPTSPQDLGRSITQVRNAMKKANPEAALMTEHAGSDYLSQFYDGSWDQTFIKRFDFAEKYFDDLRLNIFRFYFPNFKLSAWGNSFRHARKNLFNGMGMDMGGAENKDEQRLYAHAMKENGDAFAVSNPEPSVAVSGKGLLANRFAVSEKVIYTLYNTGNETVNGTVEEKMAVANGHYVELLADEIVSCNSNGQPQVSLKADSVALLACFPQVLSVSAADNDSFKITFFPEKGDEVVICENKDDEYFHAPRGKSISLKNLNGNGVYRLQNVKSRKIIFKLKKDGYLVDEIVIKR